MTVALSCPLSGAPPADGRLAAGGCTVTESPALSALSGCIQLASRAGTQASHATTASLARRARQSVCSWAPLAPHSGTSLTDRAHHTLSAASHESTPSQTPGHGHSDRHASGVALWPVGNGAAARQTPHAQTRARGTGKCRYRCSAEAAVQSARSDSANRRRARRHATVTRLEVSVSRHRAPLPETAEMETSS